MSIAMSVNGLGLDPQTAFDKLAGFDEEVALAVFLMEEGIVGFPKEAQSCPMSNWLRRATGMEVCTYVEVIEFRDRDTDRVVRFDPTLTMQLFMAAFDDGGYSTLEAPCPAST